MWRKFQRKGKIENSGKVKGIRTNSHHVPGHPSKVSNRSVSLGMTNGGGIGYSKAKQYYLCNDCGHSYHRIKSTAYVQESETINRSAIHRSFQTSDNILISINSSLVCGVKVFCWNYIQVACFTNESEKLIILMLPITIVKGH